MTTVGRYTLLEEFAVGGMASVHLGVMSGAAGFNRVVAVKRLHRQFVSDPSFVAMLMDEARVSQRVRHPNVAQLIDVVRETDELLLVMEYLHGESFARLCRSGVPPTPAVVSAVIGQMLHGLGAAHEATAASGEPLHLVHRDVSPQNLLVGADGHARVLDFGIAHAQGRLQTTREGHLKGKIPYMAPEQIRNEPATPRLDIYAAGVVLWEALVGRRLYTTDSEASLVLEIVTKTPPSPRSVRPDLPPAADDLLAAALAPDPNNRFQTAEAFANALHHVIPPASAREVSAWVRAAGGEELQRRTTRVRQIEMQGVAATDVISGKHPPMPELASGQMSLASSVAGGRRNNALFWALLVGALVGTGAAVGLFFFRQPHANKSPAAATLPESSAELTAEPSTKRATTEPLIAVTPSSEATAAATATASAALAPAQSSGSRATSQPSQPTRPATRLPTTTQPPTAAPKPDCTQRWVVGADGVKRFRKECL